MKSLVLTDCTECLETETLQTLAGPQVEVDLPNTFRLRQLQERVQVLVPDQVELINVPVPDFEDGDPADIVHDFQRVRQIKLQHHTHTTGVC